MVEPPGQARVRGVLEIDDGVLVAVEQAVGKKLTRRVRHPGVKEFRARVESVFQKAAEKGRRRGAVETMVVIENSDPHVLSGYTGKTN